MNEVSRIDGTALAPAPDVWDAQPIAPVSPREQHSLAPAAPVSELTAVLAMIERASRDPTVNMDKLERLMKMHREMKESRDAELAAQARHAFNAAMAEVQKKLPQVVRNAENTQTRSVYATMDAIGDAIDPIISDAGFMQSFGFDECPKENHYRIVCRTSYGAHERLDYIDMPVDNAGPNGTVNKTKPHALSSTASYGRRILTCLIWNVKTKKGMPDDDGNAASGKIADLSDDGSGKITPKQVEGLVELIDFYDAETSGILKFFGIARLADMSSGDFQRAVAMLNQKHGSKKK